MDVRRTFASSPLVDACSSAQYFDWMGNGYTSGLIAGSYRFGAGRLVLNTFRILENLDHNPAADRLLLNMIRYAAGLVKQP